ncbi:hypothetical protein [Flavobacterium sp. UMI-01]|uniref:hypothetical protein n=1 Tax=Flavobacterium sp. UMI-01 TaxID=1441053 RepID=UPI001C7D1F37|nr:hypothetical protein [Flavobacterium sp. UMI-01]GIZ08350.1 hypothetical protein FUMI01_10770 [Flavobacterium sp. UMI-01]
MAKKTIKDLRPRDTVWYVNNNNVFEYKIDSISTKKIIGKDDCFNAEINDSDLTAWQFEAIEKYHRSPTTIYLNKIDALKIRHAALEKELEATYAQQQKYFESIAAKNKAIYNSNLEIINELKNQK